MHTYITHIYNTYMLTCIFTYIITYIHSFINIYILGKGIQPLVKTDHCDQ